MRKGILFKKLLLSFPLVSHGDGFQAPIHNAAPNFEDQGKTQEILVTGIKVRIRCVV